MGSPAVKRIEDVRLLRSVQFPEDSGPLAHPIRPDSYQEISNFYTSTVYNKGAEVIRMMRTLMGDEAFRKGTDLYFERHDGQAVTCDDFVAAMEDASGLDLSQFRLWYSQAGTPRIEARLDHDAASKRATLHLRQSIPDTPGQTGKQPMVLPLRTALIGADSGRELGEERVILLDRPAMSVEFDGVEEEPLLSINRDFSTPAIVAVERRPGELERLAEVDGDPFARFEALQELMYRALVAGADGQEADFAPVVAAMGATLRSNALDTAFKGEALIIPGEAMIGDRLALVDPKAVHASRDALRRAVGSALLDDLVAAQSMTAPGSDLSPQAKGVRRLRSVALGLIAAADPARGVALAKAQYDAADNMTDRQAGLATLVSLDGPEREAALADFYDRYRGDTLVIDKWFSLQAMASRADTLDQVDRLRGHGDFTMKNPNRLRALAGAFASNPWVFHSGNGRGYRMLADFIIAADAINPQVAARLVPPLGRWRRFVEPHGSAMRAELERVAATPRLSKDVFEQVTKSLI
jgi:aminopeptidase N